MVELGEIEYEVRWWLSFIGVFDLEPTNSFEDIELTIEPWSELEI